MSKRLLLLNLVLIGVAAVLAGLLVQTFTTARQLPRPPVKTTPPPPPVAVTKDGEVPDRAPLPSYSVIATKSLFNPNRAESGTVQVAPTAKPILQGVVLRDDKPSAFLEDPATKKVLPYKVGDTVAGGQLERIEMDRVVIRRGEGTFEVLLKDPSKPKPVAPTPVVPTARPGAPPAQPQAQAPATPAVQPPPPAPPNIFRRPQKGTAGQPATNAPPE